MSPATALPFASNREALPAAASVLVFPVDHPAVRLVTLDALLGVYGYAAAAPDVMVPIVQEGESRRRGVGVSPMECPKSCDLVILLRIGRAAQLYGGWLPVIGRCGRVDERVDADQRKCA